MAYRLIGQESRGALHGRHRPAGAADPADGGPASAQAHGRTVRRGGVCPLSRQPVCPAVLRRDILPASVAAGPLVLDALAPADRRRADGGAAGREPASRAAWRRPRGEAPSSRHPRHHGAAESRDASDRQQAAASGHRAPGPARAPPRPGVAAILCPGGEVRETGCRQVDVFRAPAAGGTAGSPAPHLARAAGARHRAQGRRRCRGQRPRSANRSP